MDTVAARRGTRACLAPIVLDHLVDDPEAVRELARRSGPYAFPERPGGYVWPTWHSTWASGGGLHVEGAAALFAHPRFVAAAAEMCGTADVVPENLYVNIGTPWVAQPVMHTDMPLFRGIDQTRVPGWFLQAMGTSRLFEAERVNSVTAVAWFHSGAQGGFRYWPDGPDRLSRTQERVWNTAIVGDNDFMYHRVERIGPSGTSSPPGMTPMTVLDHDGESWSVSDGDRVLGRYDDSLVRLSVSWRAEVDDGTTAATTLEEVYERMAAAIGADRIVATGVDDLLDEPSRLQLMDRWPGFLPA